MIGVPPTHSRGSWMGSGHKGTMDLWLWLLYFLPVSGSLKVLPEVQLDVEWGGSITIKCPLPQTPVRMYLCRQMTDPGTCTTVVSNHFVKKDYKGRVTLKPCLDKKLFLVGMTQLTESDNGIYACGVGINTDRGKTQKITLNVHNEYKPFWEDEPISEPPRWFPKFLQPIPNRHQVVEYASSSEFISKVTTQAPRTEALPAHQPSSMAPVTRPPKLSRTSLVLSTTASKTSAQQALGPLVASYSHQTRLPGQRTPRHGPQYGREDRGLHIPIPEFHILIPTCLGFLLLVLLGLMVKRAMQRKKAFSRRVGRVAMRMRGREASRPVPSQRLGVPQRPRSQNNVYSACPRRAPEPNSMGPAEAPLLSTPASACPALPQVLEAPWPHTPSLKASCEYVTLCHQPAVNVEDSDSDDYINIPGLPHLPKVTLDPRPSCQ
ncbi:fas apoptotic inhibitory molecule 3 [Psammomys obesus]|uniref:fas apoptotic inhibitory molecule 3 n=1 Tax=Psammomys obesus TaxID=48139 RepID=UPI0024536FBC|nr:fas apoptotic inhibitory molecule 3 [Psammomys obesus]